jgi:hypothetical protein
VPRAARVAAAILGCLVVVLVAIQLFLPGIAERRLRDRLERSGTVEGVEISAFPAVKLLWDRADEVTVRMGELTASQGSLADLIARTTDAEDVDASAREQRILTLRLHESRLRKRGEEIELSSSVDEADLRAALPPGFDLRPVASGDGALVFQGSAQLFGQTFEGEAVVAVRDGKVVLTPNVPFGALASLTLFDDPRVEVESIGARPSPGGFTLEAQVRVS